MPIYEFDCHECGDNFETLVFSFSAIDKVACPVCESKDVHKRLSTFAVKGNQNSAVTSTASRSSAGCSSGGV